MRNQMKYVIQIKLILLITWATQAFADDSFYGDISYQVQKKNSSANDYSNMVKPCLGVLVQGFSEDHPAVDISGIRNRPLVSMGDGKIKKLFRNQQFGNAIILSLDNGLELLYAHLENYKTDDGNLKEGQRVVAGERVGTMGTTGWSTGIHLHLEIRKNRKLIDPEPILRRLDYKPKTTQK